MTTRVLRLTLGLALIAIGAASPARAQFSYPVIIVPPAAQNYASPKPSSRATTRNRPKPSAESPQPEATPVYRGQTQQLNRF